MTIHFIQGVLMERADDAHEPPGNNAALGGLKKKSPQIIRASLFK
jgi:hypothetical protein